MKKGFYILFFILIGILILTSLILPSKTSLVFTFNKSYNKVYNDDFTFNVKLFYYNKQNEFINKDNINKVKIYNDNLEMKLELNKIDLKEDFYKEKEVLRVTYYFNFSNIYSDLIIDNCNLYIESNNNKIIDLKIGDISFIYKIDYINNDISFNDVLGLYETYNKVNLLKCLYLELDLIDNSFITITNIKIGDNKIYLSDYKLIEDSITKDYNINDLNSNYNPLNKEELKDYQITLKNTNKDNKILLFISYEELKVVEDTYIIITYLNDNKEELELIINNFNLINIFDYKILEGVITYYDYQ